jgi:transposase InsO family protein
MRVVMAALAALFASTGRIPRQLQTDRGPCFVGADDARRAAVPSRLTLWLAGLDITHRLIPAGRPQHNGAVERFHGGVEYSWQGEPDGLAALIEVWNASRPPLSADHQPYRGRDGFALERVWALLGQTTVTRQVDRSGRISLWDRAVWVGRKLTGQAVTVTFDPASQQVVIRDLHERVLRQATLPWLTEDWLWEPMARTDLDAHDPDRSQHP